MTALRDALAAAGLRLRSDEYGRDKLAKLRSMYEPYVHSTAKESDVDAAAVAVRGEERATTGRRGRGIELIQARGLAVLGQKSRDAADGDDHF